MNDLFREQLEGGRSNGRDGRTLRESALDFATTLLDNFDSGKVTPEYGYGIGYYRAVGITLAGGGPGAQLFFVFDGEGDLDHAYIDYFDMYGGQCLRLPEWYAERLQQALDVRASS